MQTSDVLSRPSLITELDVLANEAGYSREELDTEAAQCLKEMAAAPSRIGLSLYAALGRYIYSRAFDRKVEFAPGDIDRIGQLLRDKPVAFTATHKSHLDGFVLGSMFYELGLPSPYVFGGINMKIAGFGELSRKAGAIFIRRSFHDDPVYKAVFKNYINFLGEKRVPLMWALEGTRSRTGKLMPPRYGMISYVVNAYIQDGSPDLLLVPVSTIFDQVPEVDDYDALQAGGEKRPESLSWFMQYLRSLKKPHGKIHVRFGRGIALSEFIHSRGTNEVSQDDIRKIAFALAVDVNSVTPVTVNALLSYIFLSCVDKPLTVKELSRETAPVCRFVDSLSLPTTTDIEQLDLPIIENALSLLCANGIVKLDADGLDSTYAVASRAARKAAYYRNNIIHFFVTSAIADLALLSITRFTDEAVEQVREEALKIRDLMKFEFFFEEKTEFIRKLEAELDLRSPGWQETVIQGPEAVKDLLRSMDHLVGHSALRPFIEAYQIVAEVITLSGEEEIPDRKVLLLHCLQLGKQHLQQERIHCEESISTNYFENAIELAASRGLFETTHHISVGRQQFFEELNVLASRARVLASMAEELRFSNLTERPGGH